MPENAAARTTPTDPVEAAPPETQRPALRLTQLGLAEYLAAQLAHQLRHVSEHNTWLSWTSAGWVPDPHRVHTTARLTQVLRTAGPDKEQEPDLYARRKAESFLAKQETKANLDSILGLLARQSTIATSAATLDAHPDLLGTANATIDLRSGNHRTPKPDDLITQRLDVTYDTDATCPRWERFLSETISDDTDAMAYLQQLVGYTLTGHTSVQQMWLLTGEGSNGKSTFLNTIMRLLGPHASAAADTVLLKSGTTSGANNDVAALAGKRLISLTETDHGRHLNEARLKQLVSGDPIAARKLYQEFGTFTPVAKYFLATNHLPHVRGTDNGIWRRLVVVPFPHTFNGDPGLAGELRRELPGILTWAVRGAKAWYEQGQKLVPPQAFAAPTREYRDVQDSYGRFLDECTVPDLDAKTPAGELRETYMRWCKEQGTTPLTPNEAGARLKARGHEPMRYGKNRNAHWAGLRVKDTEPAAPEVGTLFGGIHEAE